MLLSTALLGGALPVDAQIQRVLGLDISAWQGDISQTTWNNLRNVNDRQFVILRASRGGTTGYYNQSDPNNNNGLNSLSQRYDDPYYIQNINRSTTAGIFAGSYHFSRPDIIETTPNSGGIANSGVDEADHFIQMAGPWMRPGYLVPVHDFEAGDGIRTANEMAQFCIDFSDRIYQVMGIRPAIYINGNYAAYVLGGASSSLRSQLAQPSASLPSLGSPAYPTLWSARWPNQADPDSIDVQTGEPKDSFAPIYGPWDDYGVTHPWKFWQYASTLRLSSFKNGTSNLDANVARGGVEFLKDQLVPAVWVNDSSGNWSTLANWNSGQTPIQPVAGPGQVNPVATGPLPPPRLPGAAGSGATSGQHDTVILERPNADIVVTLSSGTHNIRKLHLREALNITGGSLTVNYAPSPDSTTNGAQFSGPVTLSGSGSLSVHTLQVDAAHTFTLAAGTLTFNTIHLMPHGTTPAKLLLNGSVAINALSNVTALVAGGSGMGSPGFLDLGGATHTLTVGNGTADVDLSLDVALSNGGLAKDGAGTMRLTSASTYSGGTTVSAGRLLANNTAGSGTGSGAVTVNGGTLGGTGTIAGTVTVNSQGTVSPGVSIGTLSFNSAPTFNGTNFMEIDRNGGSPLADKLVLTSGILTYGGTLVISNTGATLTGGEVFTLFAAPAYAGSFAAITALPALGSGLNWSAVRLPIDGTVKVNRRPLANNPLTFTNIAPSVLEIPFATLAGNATDPDGDLLTVAGINLTTTLGVTLTTNSTSVLYSHHQSVNDQFSYTIGDGHGGSTTGLVNIVNIGSTPMAQFSSAPIVNGTSVLLQLQATPGWTYYLERSTNLPVWKMIGTNVAPPGGVFDYTDDFQDLGGPPTSALYRLRWSP
jgi:autotransporter-associated beta strand protein